MKATPYSKVGFSEKAIETLRAMFDHKRIRKYLNHTYGKKTLKLESLSTLQRILRALEQGEVPPELHTSCSNRSSIYDLVEMYRHSNGIDFLGFFRISNKVRIFVTRSATTTDVCVQLHDTYVLNMTLLSGGERDSATVGELARVSGVPKEVFDAHLPGPRYWKIRIPYAHMFEGTISTVQVRAEVLNLFKVNGLRVLFKPQPELYALFLVNSNDTVVRVEHAEHIGRLQFHI